MWNNDIRRPRTSCFGEPPAIDVPDYAFEVNWNNDLIAVEIATSIGTVNTVWNRESATKLREALDAFIEGRD